MRPSLLRGTLTEGRWLYGADILLHEMIHQWQQEILGDSEESYSGHGPTFSTKANEIGEKLGLPKVAKTYRADRTCARTTPRSSHCQTSRTSSPYPGISYGRISRAPRASRTVGSEA